MELWRWWWHQPELGSQLIDNVQELFDSQLAGIDD
jgi:hypothetical protein